MERLDKLFSNLGILSRSDCKSAVKKGLISVNGIPAKSADCKIDPDSDAISYEGRQINTASLVYYMLYKPAGVITATEDRSQDTVFDLIEDKRRDLAAVGRLDKDTTGILLMTNDGQLNHYLLSPKHHVPKTYQVLIDGKLGPEAVDALEKGIDIGDDRPTLPAKVRIVEDDPQAFMDEQLSEESVSEYKNGTQHVELTITEGRYHQVKRMMEKMGCPVIKLHRSSFGPLKLDPGLKPGQIRELTEEEISLLKNN